MLFDNHYYDVTSQDLTISTRTLDDNASLCEFCESLVNIARKIWVLKCIFCWCLLNGNNSATMVWIAKHQQYTPWHIMPKLLLLKIINHEPFRNVGRDELKQWIHALHQGTWWQSFCESLLNIPWEIEEKLRKDEII